LKIRFLIISIKNKIEGDIMIEIHVVCVFVEEKYTNRITNIREGQKIRKVMAIYYIQRG